MIKKIASRCIKVIKILPKHKWNVRGVRGTIGSEFEFVGVFGYENYSF